jgi:hypothetical protein
VAEEGNRQGTRRPPFARWYVANGGPLALVVLGLAVGGFTNGTAGLVLVVLGVALLIAGWLFRRNDSSDVALSAPSTPDVQILTLKRTGGGGGFVDFAAEVVNYGDRQVRSELRASVGDIPVRCEPAHLDLIPNAPPQRVRVIVPRPTTR